MSARARSAAAALGLCALAALASLARGELPPAPAAPAGPEPRAAPAAAPATGNAHGLTDTHCAVCHAVTGWRPVNFDHARTGFLLKGAHAKAACSGCHGADLSRAVPQSCSACHRDAHTGEFGTRCQGCHEETSWRPLFNADAHRRTNFPLSGRHALIPCEECHTNQRDKTFTRATVDCIRCHQADYARTGAVSIDHAAAGFPTTCRDCHLPYRWQGAHFAEHATCFEINAGPHANISCTACHTTLPNVAMAHGACSTANAACTRCHTCSAMAGQHAGVPEYQCQIVKCWQCHRFSNTVFPRAPGGLR